MNHATPRVLFHSSSRRGLGHVMRSMNLARAVMAADPDAAVLVHVTHEAAGVGGRRSIGARAMAASRRGVQSKFDRL